MSDKYNGWTNRETWLVGLWFGDDLQIHIDEDRPIVVDASYCEEYVDEMLMHTVPSGFLSDLISGAWARINWYEIADYYEVEKDDEG